MGRMHTATTRERAIVDGISRGPGESAPILEQRRRFVRSSVFAQRASGSRGIFI